MNVRLDFEQHRGYLRSLAYRMLGSITEAEDVVQDAYLRWHGVEHTQVDNTRAFLTRVVSRLCIDRLRKVRQDRNTYIGPWLPDPIVMTDGDAAELAENVSFALLLALERLSPLERAAFLLHDVFEFGYGDIAETLQRNEASCRQLAKRAREHIRAARPRFEVKQGEHTALTDAFFQAAREGNSDVLRNLLSETVVLHSDGGGRRLAALRLIRGADKVCRLFAGIARKYKNSEPLWSRHLVVNGDPGWLTLERDGFLQVTSIACDVRGVAEIYIVRNPEKLQHLRELIPQAFTKELLH